VVRGRLKGFGWCAAAIMAAVVVGMIVTAL
jgi:hypothetical protein